MAQSKLLNSITISLCTCIKGPSTCCFYVRYVKLCVLGEESGVEPHPLPHGLALGVSLLCSTTSLDTPYFGSYKAHMGEQC